MTALIELAYVIVAFVAGIIALAMPCCFSVLLPSYFAQSFNSKTRRLVMTAIFAAGIATIMLPISLGALLVAQAISAHHDLVFVAGGFLMIFFGLWTLWGRGMLPMLNLPVNLKRTDIHSVYTLGLFSGAATTCCAPVLAGVVVLSALSTNLGMVFTIGLSYVLGMVFPLLMIALVWDKYALSASNPFRGRMLYLNHFGREFSIHSSKLIAGAMFIVMGAVTVALGVTGTMIAMPGTAVVAVLRAGFQDAVVGFFSDARGVVAVAAAGIFIVLGSVYALRERLSSLLRMLRPESERSSKEREFSGS